MYLRLVVLAMLLLLQMGNGMAQDPNSTPSIAYLYNFAKIKDHLGQGDYVTVRSGPGTKFRQIDRLHSGREVYICDERGDWFKIFYSRPDGPCGSTSTNGLNTQKTKGCQAGWIEKKWIDVISG